MSYGSIIWFSRANGDPQPGTRLLVFTPTDTDIRYRICDASLLPTMSEATHFAYLAPPADYFGDDHAHG